MKNRFKSKHKNHGKFLSKIICSTIIFVLLFTIFLLSKFVNKINKSLYEISSNEITRVTERLITDKLNSNIFNNEKLANLLLLEKNSKEEIVYIDFNLENAYQILDEISNILTSSLEDLQNGNISVTYLDEQLSHNLGSMILSIPIGNSFDNMYFYNIGPKIPTRINFIGSVLTNLKTKVTNYGFNNALVELFIYIEFKTEIVSPFNTKTITLNYDAIIASMMVKGEVPSFYGGSIEKESNIYQSNLSK